MSEVFIEKVRGIILDHFHDKNFDVQKLASIIGMSRSQVLRKVKIATGKSINFLIKEIRLSESVKLINNEEYTFAEIAYKVGFNNPQYFNKCFHDFYGYTPGEYKKSKVKGSVQAESSRMLIKKKYFKVFFYILSFTVLMILGYNFILKKAILKKSIKKYSIAVLPFDDFSMESDTEWFCDGVTEDILYHLSKIEGLRVISRTSTNQYKDSYKTIPEIAKELGVSYLVEGSVRKQRDTIVITAQLIDASENHLWGNSYNNNFQDVLKISVEVSKKIVEQLKIVISPEEKIALDEKPTENFEAYQLFLKGNFIADSQTKEDLEKSIKLFKQAIVLDPNYAESYAEMAYSYLVMANFGYINSNDARKEIIFYTGRALKINPNTVRAYSILGSLYCMDEDFEKSKLNFEKALEINPNDATSHYLFADYFKKKPVFDAEKWLIHIREAQQLDPTSVHINNDLVLALLHNGKTIEAEEHFSKMKFLFNKLQQTNILGEIRSIENKDWTEKTRLFERAVGKEPDNIELRLGLAMAYQNINHDYPKMMVHLKKIYETNPSKIISTQKYFYSLLLNRKFSIAKGLINNQSFISRFSDDNKKMLLLDYHYYRDEFEKALEFVEESTIDKYYYINACISAKIKDEKGTYDALKYVSQYQHKVIVFANLKAKDSMYYYLNKITRYDQIKFVNGSPEMNLYREELRYKKFLKKNYLPVIY